MRDRPLMTSTVGYMSVAFTLWFLVAPFWGWFERPDNHNIGTMLVLAGVLAIAGILSLVGDHTLDAVIFFGGVAIIGAAHAYVGALTDSAGQSNNHNSEMGWYCVVGASFFFNMWLGSFRAGQERFLFLLALWLALSILALGLWANSYAVTVLGHDLGLLASALAAFTSVNPILRSGADASPGLTPRRRPGADPSDPATGRR